MNDEIESDMDLPKVGYTFLACWDSCPSCWRKYNSSQKVNNIQQGKYLLR